MRRQTSKRKTMRFGAGRLIEPSLAQPALRRFASSRWDTLAGQPLGKMVAIAMVLGLLSSGLVMVLVPEEAGGDSYPVGEAGEYVIGVPAKLDTDEYIDFVTIDYDKNVRVWRNDGTPWGSWNSTVVGIIDGTIARGLAVGDFDNNGTMDIVTGDHNGFIVAWRNDGTPFDGPWNEQQVGKISGSDDVFFIDIGDLDKDNFLDIVTSDQDGRLIAWENDGSPFDDEWDPHQIGEQNNDATSVDLVDLDNDGYLDTVSVDAYDKTVHLWRNDHTPFDVPWTTSEAGTAPNMLHHVDHADLDGDGYNDLITGDDNGNYIIVWENDGSPFIGSWNNTIIGGGTGRIWISPDDFNLDGKVDVISGDRDNRVIFWENAGNPFSTPWIKHELGEFDDWIKMINLADFNHDGDSDILICVINGDIHLWDNDIYQCLNVTSSQPIYYPGDLSTLEYLFRGGQANITSLVRQPDGKVYLMETVETQLQPPEVDEHTEMLWHFEEEEGTSIIDASGNGYNGTFHNNPTRFEGKIGQAMELNQETQDRIEIEGGTSWNAGTEGTVEAWVYLEDKPGTPFDGYHYPIIAKATSTDSNTQYPFMFGFRGYPDDHAIGMAFGTSGFVNSNTILDVNKWYHIAGTWKDTNVKIYINGHLDADGYLSDVPPSGNQPLYIGSWGSMGNTNFFNGSIDELCISDISLTAEEIASRVHQSATLQFRLPDDAPIGTWTVYATNDVDDSTANLTFEVLPPPPEPTITLNIQFPDEVKQGETLNVDFIVTNGFQYSMDILLGLQLKDPQVHALQPDIQDVTIEAATADEWKETTWQLSVKIPDKAETGEYFLQGQMLTGWPDEGGYVLDYKTFTDGKSVTVTPK